MEVGTITEPRDFLARAAPLLADEARHNLMLGIVRTLAESPDVYPDFRLFLVEGPAGTPLAAASITPPQNIVVADAVSIPALQPLAEAVAADGIAVSGALGNKPTIGHFVDQWRRVTGVEAEVAMNQGVFALERVTPARPVSGIVQVATLLDQLLIEHWMVKFIAEALPDEPHDEERMRKAISRRLTGQTKGAYWLWTVDGKPVSLSGHGNPTGTGIRIGPVYTPPQHRGRGYASALVAAQSKWLLDNGYRFCFLYTDLANLTSNAIYERIGYHQIAESVAYKFSAASG